jgi:hypothetical protein
LKQIKGTHLGHISCFLLDIFVIHSIIVVFYFVISQITFFCIIFFTFPAFIPGKIFVCTLSALDFRPAEIVAPRAEI